MQTLLPRNTPLASDHGVYHGIEAMLPVHPNRKLMRKTKLAGTTSYNRSTPPWATGTRAATKRAPKSARIGQTDECQPVHIQTVPCLLMKTTGYVSSTAARSAGPGRKEGLIGKRKEREQAIL